MAAVAATTFLAMPEDRKQLAPIASPGKFPSCLNCSCPGCVNRARIGIVTTGIKLCGMVVIELDCEQGNRDSQLSG